MKINAGFHSLVIASSCFCTTNLRVQDKKDSAALLLVLGDEIVSWDKKDVIRYASHSRALTAKET